MRLCESCRLGNVDVGDKECVGCRVSELCLEIEALSGALCDLNVGCLDLDKRLALAMSVVEAAREVTIGENWCGNKHCRQCENDLEDCQQECNGYQLREALSALDAAQSEEGKT